MNFHERALPGDESAERACVGAVVASPSEVLADVQKRLPHGRAEFLCETLGDVYQVVCDMVSTGKSLDRVTVKAELLKAGKLTKLGGVEFIQSLVDEVPSVSRAAEYADLVHGYYIRRQIIGACYDAAEHAFSDRNTADASLAFAGKSLERIADMTVTNSRSSVDELMDAVCTQFESGKGIPMIETHLHDLNEITGGLAHGELCVIAARPSCGKSALAVNFADHAANTLGHKVLFVSLEMTGLSVATRILANHAGVNSQHIQFGRSITGEQSERMQIARARVRKRNLHIDDSSGLTISQIVAMCRADWTKRGTTLFAVDYLSLIRSDPGYRVERRDILIGEFTSRLKAVAKECNASVLLLAQLNRENAKANRAPTLSDLRESGNIEQDADVVLFIHDPAPDEPPLHIEQDNGRQPILTRRRQIIIGKNRNGSIGSKPIDVAWTPAYQRFGNLNAGDGATVMPYHGGGE